MRKRASVARTSMLLAKNKSYESQYSGSNRSLKKSSGSMATIPASLSSSFRSSGPIWADFGSDIDEKHSPTKGKTSRLLHQAVYTPNLSTDLPTSNTETQNVREKSPPGNSRLNQAENASSLSAEFATSNPEAEKIQTNTPPVNSPDNNLLLKNSSRISNAGDSLSKSMSSSTGTRRISVSDKGSKVSPSPRNSTLAPIPRSTSKSSISGPPFLRTSSTAPSLSRRESVTKSITRSKSNISTSAKKDVDKLSPLEKLTKPFGGGRQRASTLAVPSPGSIRTEISRKNSAH
jgi:hypothetical protein